MKYREFTKEDYSTELKPDDQEYNAKDDKWVDVGRVGMPNPYTRYRRPIKKEVTSCGTLAHALEQIKRSARCGPQGKQACGIIRDHIKTLEANAESVREALTKKDEELQAVEAELAAIKEAHANKQTAIDDLVKDRNRLELKVEEQYNKFANRIKYATGELRKLL